MAAATSSRVAAGLGADALKPLVPVKSIVKGFEDEPLPTFAEAIADIADAGVIPDVTDMAEITYASALDAKTYGALKDDPAGTEGIACLMKYSAEDSEPPIYKDMNDKCYKSDRRLVRVYAKFLWLLVKTMQVIEPYPSDTVFRGVKANLRSDYPAGREFTWHSPTSCTKSMEVLSNPMFCGQSGARTIFVVKLTQGQAREITRYSLIAEEDEILLPPGCRFKVESVLPQGDLTIVQLVEIPSREWFLNISPPARADEPPNGPQLWHGTTLRAAIRIAQSGFEASSEGFFGPGVYLTASRDKAEAWAWYKASPLVGYGKIRDPPTWDDEATTPAIVSVKAAPGKCRNFDFDADERAPAYRWFHRMYTPEHDISVLDEFGRYRADNQDNCRLQGREQGYNAVVRDAQSWKPEGFDAIHVSNTGKLKVTNHSDKYDVVDCDARWLGDEWVLARSEQATYLSHTALPSVSMSKAEVDKYRQGTAKGVGKGCTYFGKQR